MSESRAASAFTTINGALIHHEIAGAGPPLVMIHAGVADSRQWNAEFDHFAQRWRVLRYDLRGYGRSEPVDGDFSHLADLTALLAQVRIGEPLVAIGCSMGGGLAIELALAAPARVRALVLVGSGPSGLQLDVPRPAKFAEAEKAWEAGDLDACAEIETQIWFDGIGRTPAQVDRKARRLLFEMNRLALAHEVKKLGRRRPDSPRRADERIGELRIPVLAIVGEHDLPFAHAAADFIVERAPAARKVVIDDAAHLPNMEHPVEFRRLVESFLDGIPRQVRP